MPEPYTSYEAKLLKALIDMLAASSTFRALVGASTDAAALARIIEYHGGQAAVVGKGKAIACDGTTFECAGGSYAVVVALDFPDDDALAQRFESRAGEALWLLRLRPPVTVGPTERLRWALNQAGLIRADLKAQVGTPGKLANAAIALRLDPIPDESGHQVGAVDATLTASWSNQ